MTTSIRCGPLTVSADFDSGNVLRAELIYPVDLLRSKVAALPSTSSSCALSLSYPFENQDYELNIWTRPDCYGTSFENGNRTWFYFGVNGGKSNGVIKINIANLNKQTKLFLQGMQPVVRILPDKSKWERIDDRIIINENKPQENGCSISFRVKLPEDPNKSTLYVAFTYPYTYLELCDVLTHLDSEFLNKISKPVVPKAKLNRRDLWLNPAPSSENDIYYHRECVCYSLEGRRVDLLTISSIYGVSDKREDRLANLFPISQELRPFKFPGKKVVFLSARVHPGETPSSFVLNGFLRFIMQKTDPRAVILRRLFVFKFIPILNPDGVFKGHYRTDPRGVNLNRVYLCPSAKLHPSIYAARKLLIYYHSGVDPPEASSSQEESEENVELQRHDCTTNSSVESISLLDAATPPRRTNSCEIDVKYHDSSITLFSEDTCFDPLPGPAEHGSVILNPHNQACQASTSSKKPYTFVLSDANSICAGCVPLDDSANCSSGSMMPSGGQSRDSLNESFGSTHQCAFEACDEDSVLYENLKLNDPISNNNMEIEQQPGSNAEELSVSSSSGSRVKSSRRKKKGSPVKDKKQKTRQNSESETISKDKRLGSASTRVKKPPPGSSTSGVFDNIKWPFDTKTARLTRSQKGGMYKSTSTSRYYDPSSGLFLYVDMHGHTTKRGIFMYGNHFADVNTQAECMLVPRLMAINSPHFDFAACNFTERLMCCKDKKDGLSREGSGRVACLKLTGLVRSYTLECNYNTGRVVNPIVPRPSAAGFVDDAISSNVFQPPKYTIELFEQVGKSLAETVLDMSGQNPFSRLNTTELKTVEGVKRSLVNRLKLSPEFKSVINIVGGPEPSMKTEPHSTSSLDMDGNSPLGSKINRKLKSNNKVLTPSQTGGPLGPKNRENQNSHENVKPVGSQSKIKLPKKQLSRLLPDDTGASSSSKSASLPKTKLGKAMKHTNFPRVSSSKIKKKFDKSDKSLTK